MYDLQFCTPCMQGAGTSGAHVVQKADGTVACQVCDQAVHCAAGPDETRKTWNELQIKLRDAS